MLIEQAIFTSAQTRHRDGYQIVSTSPGVQQEDLREISSWGPSHDSLLPSNTCIGSINFHRLESSLFCISKTLPAGFEYSGRGGHEIYTHFFIVSPELLSRFANDPFRLLEAVSATGRLNVLQEIPDQLDAFPLPGRVTSVDISMLKELLKDYRPEILAFLIQQVLKNKTIGISGIKRTENLFSGLLNLLPPVCRSDHSFSTGLKYSPRRDYRWIRLPEENSEYRRLQRQTGLVSIDISSIHTSECEIHHGWATLIFDIISRDRLSELADFYELLPSSIQSQDLDQCAQDLLEAESLEYKATTDGTSGNSIQQAHGAHPIFEGSQQSIELDQETPETHCKIDLQFGGLVEKLEELDGVVFEAFDGNKEAFDELKTKWPEVVKNLSRSLLEESREEYVRYALTSWIRNESQEGEKAPERAMTALKVLCLLFGEVDK